MMVILCMSDLEAVLGGFVGGFQWRLIKRTKLTLSLFFRSGLEVLQDCFSINDMLYVRVRGGLLCW